MSKPSDPNQVMLEAEDQTKNNIQDKVDKRTRAGVRVISLFVLCMSDLDVIFSFCFLRELIANVVESQDIMRIVCLVCVSIGMVCYTTVALYLGPRQKYRAVKLIQKLVREVPTMFYVQSLDHGRSLTPTDKLQVGTIRKSIDEMKANKEDFEFIKTAMARYELAAPWRYVMRKNAKNRTERKHAIPFFRTARLGFQSEWHAQDLMCILNANFAYSVTTGIFQVLFGAWMIGDHGVNTQLLVPLLVSLFSIILSLLNVLIDFGDKLSEIDDRQCQEEHADRLRKARGKNMASMGLDPEQGMRAGIEQLKQDLKKQALTEIAFLDMDKDWDRKAEERLDALDKQLKGFQNFCASFEETKANLDGSSPWTEDLMVKGKVKHVIQYMGMPAKRARQMLEVMLISDPGAMPISSIAALSSETVERIASGDAAKKWKMGKSIVQFWLLCSDAATFVGSYRGGGCLEMLTVDIAAFTADVDEKMNLQNGFQTCGIHAVSNALTYLLFNETKDFKEKVTQVLQNSPLKICNIMDHATAEELLQGKNFRDEIHKFLVSSCFRNADNQKIADKGCTMKELLGRDDSLWGYVLKLVDVGLSDSLVQKVKPGRRYKKWINDGLQCGDNGDLKIHFELTANLRSGPDLLAKLRYDDAIEIYRPGNMLLFEIPPSADPLRTKKEKAHHWMMLSKVEREPDGTCRLCCIDSCMPWPNVDRKKGPEAVTQMDVNKECWNREIDAKHPWKTVAENWCIGLGNLTVTGPPLALDMGDHNWQTVEVNAEHELPPVFSENETFTRDDAELSEEDTADHGPRGGDVGRGAFLQARDLYRAIVLPANSPLSTEACKNLEESENGMVKSIAIQLGYVAATGQAAPKATQFTTPAKR